MADGILYSLPETSGSGINASPPVNNAYNGCQDISCDYLLGGDVINGSAGNWSVSQLTVWVVDNENVSSASGGVTVPSEFATGLGLVGGVVTGSGATTGGTVAPVTVTSYTVSPAPYTGSSNGSNYLASFSGQYDGVWQVTFNVAGLTIFSGQDYAFAVTDPANGYNVSLNATACGVYTFSSCMSNGIDVIDSNGNLIYAYDYGTTSDQNPVVSSDVDVTLEGTSFVPEPTTLLLLGAGVGMLGLVRRRRR